ncbi:carboxyl-terminal processing protease [Nitrosovibrio tenuis]|uniref:Carboxyl-terminal processing protease n=2 Tax=Nitrosovibrio tenuis TaxID=1233 RepID=A0A1H7MK50_9PROT|nr:carboxyl-terminal processing protease [Nitrosovibrio tenuis]
MLLAAFFAGYLVRTLPLLTPREGTPQREADSTSSNSAISQYTEALAHIRQSAVFLRPTESMEDLTASTLKAYLAQEDPYSDFLTSGEYMRFKAAGSQIHAGIGLDIEKQRNGDVICYPLPEGPAARAGVQPGERLLALDGISITGKSIPAVVALAMGQPGTHIILELEDHSGIRRQLTITRSLNSFPAVSEYTHRSIRIIKLTSFTPATRKDLEYMLSDWSKAHPVIVDLRNCGGGDFHAAVDAAMLFLKQGEPIISVKSRSGMQSYSSTIEPISPTQRVFLWQDELTASAAEIFIAALVENGRAASVGRITAGKGTRQDVIELKNGGALILTTGYLVTPRGVQFDGRGLAPTYPVKQGSANTDYFFDKTASLIN